MTNDARLAHLQSRLKGLEHELRELTNLSQRGDKAFEPQRVDLVLSKVKECLTVAMEALVLDRDNKRLEDLMAEFTTYLVLFNEMDPN